MHDHAVRQAYGYIRDCWNEHYIEPAIEKIRDILIENYDENNTDHVDLIAIKEEALERYPE